jgi:hypothetical protein
MGFFVGFLVGLCLGFGLASLLAKTGPQAEYATSNPY